MTETYPEVAAHLVDLQLDLDAGQLELGPHRAVRKHVSCVLKDRKQDKVGYYARKGLRALTDAMTASLSGALTA